MMWIWSWWNVFSWSDLLCSNIYMEKKILIEPDLMGKWESHWVKEKSKKMCAHIVADWKIIEFYEYKFFIFHFIYADYKLSLFTWYQDERSSFITTQYFFFMKAWRELLRVLIFVCMVNVWHYGYGFLMSHQPSTVTKVRESPKKWLKKMRLNENEKDNKIQVIPPRRTCGARAFLGHAPGFWDNFLPSVTPPPP
jgi:hypothetical protein